MNRSIYIIVECMNEYECYCLPQDISYSNKYPAFLDKNKAEIFLEKINSENRWFSYELLEIQIKE